MTRGDFIEWQVYIMQNYMQMIFKIGENPDHQADYSVLIPIWKGDDTQQYIKEGYVFINDFEDAEGQLPIPRLGFCVK